MTLCIFEVVEYFGNTVQLAFYVLQSLSLKKEIFLFYIQIASRLSGMKAFCQYHKNFPRRLSTNWHAQPKIPRFWQFFLAAF